jgi:LSM domain
MFAFFFNNHGQVVNKFIVRAMSLRLNCHLARSIVASCLKVSSPTFTITLQIPHLDSSSFANQYIQSAAEDNMNVQLKDITATARDGRVSHLDQVYIRGSHVRFIIVPDMLRNAPMFRSRGTRGRGVGLARGRATVNRARAGRRG